MASSSSGVETTPASSTEPSRTATPASAAVAEKAPDDSSKLKTFLGILRKFMGVSDIAAVRFSLPAQLLEPTPNLEYWNYLDRPETFIAIGDSEEALGRMLGTLRFWFTKDLKYVKGKPCKPYNSALGEFFRCNWEIEDTSPPLKSAKDKPAQSSASSTISTGKTVKVSYLTEQTSHHPPVSAFWVDCPEKGITAKGYDQLSAKFTGTSIRVTPGAHNLGIFITLHKWDDEQYQLTHPAAHLGGLLRGSLSVTVADICYITCPKTKIKVILHYLEEGWLGKTQNKVEGVIFTYDPEKDDKTRIRDVPDKDVLARIEGCWHDKIYYSIGSQPVSKAAEKILLIDVGPLFPVPKIIPPEEAQLPNESRKFWGGVTEAIVTKQYALATTRKQELEERQREKAAVRKEKEAEWQPRFFSNATDANGKPDLTEEGRLALDGLHKGDYKLEESKELGA
ncbi:putative oxysterol binding protein [Lasiodiplodia theobromae]|uniref:Oxysterol-binding protein-like protein 1 n=1 Tax=Lasiodiplodia theobromae TaxID=45133 RepID=A0A5N5DET9_9PEZI|nr:Oxysterol binding protein [Lasiodiplodia theobromae]KAB2576318.1 Oxysterol-binding protein-like protein 1 [Lasiodiplodia theobromae]KAF4533930.1 Oxysterol binding protein [Lasiodiplodia theobromae]KAF9638218.1 putative oxysterol binding protein [Lasiodiplodia theobromae]